MIIPRTESPTTRSTTSSISSLASIEKDGDGAEAEAETDTELLRRYYLKKVEGRFERVYEGLEKADIWFKIVTTVLLDVDRRRGLDAGS